MNININTPIAGAPHITWAELTVTNHRELLEENQKVSLELAASGVALAQKLELIRFWWGRPIVIHSGYRCPKLNLAIGGSPTSQHMLFQAADFHVSGVSLQTVFQKIRTSDIKFGQLLLEGVDPAAGLASWVHLSLGAPWRPIERCQEVMYYSTRTGKYTRLNPPDPAFVG